MASACHALGRCRPGRRRMRREIWRFVATMRHPGTALWATATGILSCCGLTPSSVRVTTTRKTATWTGARLQAVSRATSWHWSSMLAEHDDHDCSATATSLLVSCLCGHAVAGLWHRACAVQVGPQRHCQGTTAKLPSATVLPTLSWYTTELVGCLSWHALIHSTVELNC